MITRKCLHYFIIIFIGIVLLAAPYAAFGDLIEFEDGSNIFGKIKKIKDGKIFINTLFAADITVEQDQVVGLFIEDKVYIVLKDKRELFGEISIEPDPSYTHIGDQLLKIDISKIEGMWREGEAPVKVKIEDIQVPSKKSKWKWDASVNINGRSGNTDTLATAGKVTATLLGAEDQLKLYFSVDNAESNDIKTSDELKGGVDFEAGFPNSNHSGFISFEAEHDVIEAIDLRLTTAAGYGYYFIKTSQRQLRGRIGLQFRHEEFIDNGRQNDPGFELGLFGLYQFNKKIMVKTDLTHLQSTNDKNDFRSVHESSMEFPLDSEQRWKVRVGVLNEYDNEPATGKERLDTRYYVNFVLSWEQPYLIYINTR